MSRDVLEADALQMIGTPFCGTPHVALMLRQRADARDREILLQLVDIAIALHVDVVNDLFDVFHSLVLLRMLDGQIDAIAPFLPRSDVVPHAGIAEQPQREIRMRRTIAALAVGDDLAIGRHPGALVHLPQLVRRLEGAVGPEVVRPLEMHRAGHGAAARRAHTGATVLAVASRIDDDGVGASKTSLHLAPPGKNFLVAQAGPFGWLRFVCLLRDRQSLFRPGVDSRRRARAHSGWPKNSRNQKARAALIPDVSS